MTVGRDRKETGQRGIGAAQRGGRGDTHFGRALEDATGVAHIDCGALLVTRQHPHFPSGGLQHGNGLGDFVLQLVLNRYGTNEPQFLRRKERMGSGCGFEFGVGFSFADAGGAEHCSVHSRTHEEQWNRRKRANNCPTLVLEGFQRDSRCTHLCNEALVARTSCLQPWLLRKAGKRPLNPLLAEGRKEQGISMRSPRAGGHTCSSSSASLFNRSSRAAPELNGPESRAGVGGGDRAPWSDPLSKKEIYGPHARMPPKPAASAAPAVRPAAHPVARKWGNYQGTGEIVPFVNRGFGGEWWSQHFCPI